MRQDKIIYSERETLEEVEKDTISHERRSFIQGLAALVFTSISYSPLLFGKGVKDSTVAGLSFEDFFLFSKLITGYELLDHAMAQQLYRLLTAEPWGMDHLQRLRKKLLQVDSQHLKSLDQGEQWFFGHLLTTWLTGIYYHSSGNHMVSYEHALMYDAFENIRPTPGFSTQEFGFWTEPPEQGKDHVE